MDPSVAEEMPGGFRAFAVNLVAALQGRPGEQRAIMELYAVTLMALGWLETACGMYWKEGRHSLVECFDETVEICVQSIAEDLAASLRDLAET